MRKNSHAFDEEALWFPAHMSAGDSFSRPIGIDGGADGFNAPEDMTDLPYASFGPGFRMRAQPVHAPADDDIGLPRRNSAFAFSDTAADWPDEPASVPEPSNDDGIGLPGRIARRGGRPPRKGGIRPSSWLWLTLWGAAAIGIVGYAARKDIAAEMVQSWLHGQGVPAKLKFDTLSLGHATGHIVLGDAAKPDLSIAHFDVDYSLNPFAGSGQPTARLISAHLSHPVLNVALKDGKLNFGTLDKLVQSILSAPPSNAPPPQDIAVDDAQVNVRSDYGIVSARGALTLHDNALTHLLFDIPVTHLEGLTGEGDISGGHITAQAVHDAQNGDQIAVKAHLGLDHWNVRNAQESPVESADAASNLHVQTAAVDIDTHLPYAKEGAYGKAGLNGAVQGTVAVTAQTVQGRATQVDGLSTTIGLDGDLKSSAKTTHYEGGLRLASHAAHVSVGGTDSRDITWSGPGMGLRAAWSADNGLALSIGGALTGDVGLLRQAAATFKGAHLKIDTLALTSDSTGSTVDLKGGLHLQNADLGDLTLSATTLSLKAHGHSDTASSQWAVTAQSYVTSNGHYGGLSALARSRATDTPRKPGTPEAPPKAPGDGIIALDRAFDRFSVRAKGLDISLTGDGTAAPQFDIRLHNAAEADLDGGGQLIVTPQPNKALLASRDAAGLSLTLNGPNLPKLSLDIGDLAFDKSGALSGSYALSSQFTLDPVSGAKLDARGHFTSTHGLAVTLDAPAAFSAQSAELGDHLEALSGTLDQTGGALVHFGPDGWSVTGTYKDLSLNAPGQAIRLSSGQGTLNVFSIPSANPGLNASLTTATVSDLSPHDQTRFNPLALTGTLTQDARALTGRFVAATPKKIPVATINLDNDPVHGKGSLSFKTLDFKFAPGGLQPVDLSPAAAVVLNRNVTGSASFTGAFTWDKGHDASAGVLKVDGLSFTTASLVTQNLKGEVDFTSLSPLISKPAQLISVDHIDAGLPLLNLTVGLHFAGDHIAIERAEVDSPGGRVTLAPMDVPLGGNQTIAGTVSFNGLDFGKIVAATSLSQNMTFTGNMTGNLPFSVAGGHITFAQGHMASDAPGQISIRRQAVVGVTATGSLTQADKPTASAAATPDPAFNPFQDLATQALEYISFDRIDATVNSQANGILDTTFHIKGRFAPPQPQKATVSLSDYVSGKWLSKPLKLPSNTPLELYLDVPLNLDEILNDLTSLNGRPAKTP